MIGPMARMINSHLMSDQIRAILFDLDGTMVDNMRYHIAAWMEIGKKLGRELTPEFIQREFSGRKNEELFPLIAGRPMDVAEIVQLAEEKEARYRELYAPHVRLVEGLDSLLSRFVEQRVAVGIATAAPRKNRDFVLLGLGLAARIPVVVGAEQVKRGNRRRICFSKPRAGWDANLDQRLFSRMPCSACRLEGPQA
jgi:beta-phosphoglucomutase-like phosphatase (HAD superfamily)